VEEKNSKLNVILICIIVVIFAVLVTLFATGTISFNKDNNTGNNSENDNKPSDTKENDYTGDYDQWMNYLLTKNDLKVTVSRVRYADDYVTETYNKTVTLSNDQVKDLFTKLMNLKLVNRCTSGRGTANPNEDNIVYSYSENGVNYEVSMSGFDSLWTFYDNDKVDNTFLDAIEKSKDASEGTELDDCVYEFDGFKNTLLDEYFK